jgi:general stress protein 26
MTTPAEIEEKFWKALKSDMTMMLGLHDLDGGHARPMTGLIDEARRGPIWFFTAKDAALYLALPRHSRATSTFASKGHDLFASVHGSLSVENNRAVIDRLWNPFIAAWYEGKDDPKLALLRLDADRAEIWLNGSSLIAGIKMLFGVDPKKDYANKVAEIDLG